MPSKKKVKSRKLSTRYQRVAAYAVSVFFLMLVLILLVSSVVIGSGVQERCNIAQAKYGGDCVSALVIYLEDEQNSYGGRNSAIWALGQLGDRRALPILHTLYTGKIPNRELWDKTISQYELKKAINSIEREFNPAKLIWGFFVLE